MNKIIILILTLFSFQIEAQIKKRASGSDFNNLSDYFSFKKYKDSLNKVNKTNLDYEYLADFKKIVNKRDSLRKIELEIINNKLKEEYQIGVELKKYIGTYQLSESTNTQFYSYSGKMYVTDVGVSILPNNQLNEVIRFNYNYNIPKLLKDIKFQSGKFYLNKKNVDYFLSINLEYGIVSLSFDKTIYSFRISDFTKYEE